MDLRSYLRTLTPDGRRAFAKDIGTTIGHLNNMASGQSAISPVYSAQIELKSKGAVPRHETRPDDYLRIWDPSLPPLPPIAFHQSVIVSDVAVAAERSSGSRESATAADDAPHLMWSGPLGDARERRTRRDGPSSKGERKTTSAKSDRAG